jgi:hypothetical protein
MGELFAAAAAHKIAIDVVVRVPITGRPGAPGRVDVALEGLENVPVPAVLTAAIWNL